MIKFDVRELEEYTLVEFKLEEPISPEDLKEMRPPRVNPQKGVILSGRGPIWLYGALIHEYHPTAWVGTYDPRLGKAVITESHRPNKKIGDTVDVEVRD